LKVDFVEKKEKRVIFDAFVIWNLYEFGWAYFN